MLLSTDLVLGGCRWRGRWAPLGVRGLLCGRSEPQYGLGPNFSACSLCSLESLKLPR